MRIPMVMAAVMLLISFAIDFYIVCDIRRSGRRKIWWKIYAGTAVACWAFIIAMIFQPVRSEDSGILHVMWAIYCYLSLYVAKLVYVVVSLIGHILGKLTRKRCVGIATQWCGLVAAVAIIGVMAAGALYTRYHIQVNRVDVSSPNVPEAFNGYTIAQISDLHVGTWGSDTTFISHLVDSVNSLHPDLIVFTGDIVNRESSELEPFTSVLSRLKARDGVLSILGNHDYGDYVDWKNPKEREENNLRLAVAQKEMGWDLLNNRRVFVGRDTDSIMIIGVENWGDPPFPVYGDLETALPASEDSVYNQNDNNFKILLTHNPEHWNQVVSHTTNIDLSLAGHTHAMQMMIDLGGWKWSPARYRYTQWGGMYERENNNGELTRLYVNIGAGEVGMPARLMSAYPEITLFTLKHSGI